MAQMKIFCSCSKHIKNFSDSWRNGFTLVEMAVLLVVTGFIIATVLPRIISGTKKDLMIESKRIVRTAREEVLGWYIASNPHSLPNSTQFNESIGHRIGRRKSPLTYHHSDAFDLNATLPDKENPGPIAFWVVSPGENHVFDGGNDYNASDSIIISYYDPDEFDDIVDFVTTDYLGRLTTTNGPDDINGTDTNGTDTNGTDDTNSTDEDAGTLVVDCADPPDIFSGYDLVTIKCHYTGSIAYVGDLVIDNGGSVSGSVTSTGSITIENGGEIVGSVSASGDVTVEKGGKIGGSVTCGGTCPP